MPTPPDLDPGQTAPSFADVLADPMLWLLGLGLFCYGPLEASVGAWATTFLGERGVAEKDTATLLSCFWLAFMLARLTAAFTMKPGMERGLVLALALVATLLMLGVVLCRSRGLAIFLVMAAGFVFGPIFPTLMALLLGHFPASMHGRAVGMFFAIGGIGWTLIPILIGAYARKTTLQRGFLIAVGAALGLSAVAAVLLTRGN